MTTPTKDQLAEVARQLWDAAITLENDGEFYKAYTAIKAYNKDRRQAILKAMGRLGLGSMRVSGALLLPRGAPGDHVEAAMREYLRIYLDERWDMDEAGFGEREAMGQRVRQLVQDNPFDFTSEAVRYPKTPKSPKPKETTPPVNPDPYEHLRQAIRDGKTIECDAGTSGTWRPLKLAPWEHKREWPFPPEMYRIAGEPTPQPATPTQPTPKEPTMNTTTAITITTKTLVNGTDVASLSDGQVYDLIASQEAEIKKLDAIENKPKRLVDEIAKRKAGIAALVAHLDSQVKE